MKKYTKPTVEVVNLKSSNDIAASFKAVKDKLIKSYLKDSSQEQYAVTVYATEGSALGTESNSNI